MGICSVVHTAQILLLMDIKSTLPQLKSATCKEHSLELFHFFPCLYFNALLILPSITFIQAEQSFLMDSGNLFVIMLEDQ